MVIDKVEVQGLIKAYDPDRPGQTADGLRRYWLQFEPKSTAGISAEARTRQETVGTPVPVLKAMGKVVARSAKERVESYIPLVQCLWHDYGREGRVIAVIALGAMELVQPAVMIPLARTLCRTCHTWEDADRLAMDALEPIVRKNPGRWLGTVADWLEDENRWVRRAGVTVIGRLPMKHPGCARDCLILAERLLEDTETEVKKAVSFAIRLTARGDLDSVVEFVGRHVPPRSSVSTWVICDVIRSMTVRFLPAFISWIPQFEAWVADPSLSGVERRSVSSALRKLQSAA